MNKPNTTYTRILGNLAFAAGKPCVPALDSDLSAHMAGRAGMDKRSIPEMRAWIAGWTEASLAAANA